MIDLNVIKVPFREKLTAAGDSAAAVFVYSKPIKPGILRNLTHVSAENLSNDFTKIRIGISNLGQLFYLDELQTVVANELCVSVNDLLLFEGDRFFAEFTGTTTGDLLVLVSIGWEIEA